jgi:hypothetical protein
MSIHESFLVWRAPSTPCAAARVVDELHGPFRYLRVDKVRITLVDARLNNVFCETRL